MESHPMNFELSSGADLDRAISDHSSEPVIFYLNRLNDLSEVDPLRHRLRQNCKSRPHWTVNQDSSVALLEASNYYNKLDMLELRLGLLRLEVMDIEDGVAVRKLRRVIGDKKQPGSIIDNITNEVQEIEGIASLLGFTSSLQDSASTADDVKRFFADSLVNWEDSNGEAEVKESMKSVLVEKIHSLSQVLHNMKQGRFSLGGVK